MHSPAVVPCEAIFHNNTCCYHWHQNTSIEHDAATASRSSVYSLVQTMVLVYVIDQTMTSHITRCHWNQCSEMHSSPSSSSLFRHHTISALPKCVNYHSADHMTYHPQLSTVTATWAGFSFIPSAIGSYRHLETFDMSCGIKLLGSVA